MTRRSQVVIPFAHNNSLSFTAASKYLRNSTNTTLGIGASWTIAIWIKFTVVPPSSSRIFNFKNGSNNVDHIDFLFGDAFYATNLILNNSTGAIFKNYDWLGVNNNFELDRWYHLVFTSDGTTLIHYKDGAVLTPNVTPVDNIGTQGTGTRRCAIGAQIGGTGISNFKVSSVFMWNIVLTPAEVLTLYNGGTGNAVHPKVIPRLNVDAVPIQSLVHAWFMGTGAAIVTDEVPTGGIDLTANKATGLTASDVTSDAPVVSTYTFAHDYSLDFSGTTEHMKNSTNNTIGIENAWTIALWIKPGETTFGTNRFIFNLQNSANSNDRIQIRHAGNVASDPLTVEMYNSTGTAFKVYTWNDLINATTSWQHIVFNWDGTNLRLYSDGSVVAPSATATDDAGTMGTATRRVSFASTIGGATLWLGIGHSVVVWNRALSAAEVSKVYNGGDGSAYDIKSNMSSGLKHWWLLGTTGMLGRDNVDGDGAGVRINIGLNASGISEADDRVLDAP